MPPRPWQFLKDRFSYWRELLLPGVMIISLVYLMRLGGFLQAQEWMALDSFSRYCPLQADPEQIAIVSIDAADYQAARGLPTSDQALIQALITLQRYRPRVIGFEVFREAPSGEADVLNQMLRSMPNVVVAETILSADPAWRKLPPSGMPAERVGFSDVVVDADGKLRRAVLAAHDRQGAVKYSFALQLARRYLQAEEIAFNHAGQATAPIRFGQFTLPRFRGNSGGYVRADVAGNQMLMNFCMLQRPYPVIALRDLLANNVKADQLRDRIVIIGTVAMSIRDSSIVSALQETLHAQRFPRNPTTTKLIYTVEVHAHVTQQILNSVLRRPMVLNTWSEPGEALWIMFWGLVGIVISAGLQSPWKSVLGLVAATLVMIGISYNFLDNWWIPVVPTAMALCGAGLVTAFFDRDMRFELKQRRAAIERAYAAVHNGPLQQLVVTLRGLDEQELVAAKQVRQQLEVLNLELRNIFEHMMHQDVSIRSQVLYLADNTVLDLRQPVADLLYQVYEYTTAQPLPGFTSVQNFISPKFDCLQQGRFSPEQKRDLCLFLQESLQNVGKHAVDATRVDVVCCVEARHYCLQIADNGCGFDPDLATAGQGTEQSRAIAQRLRGYFQRRCHHPQGTLCELSWPRFRRYRRLQKG